MVKKVLAGVVVSLLLTGAAYAHEGEHAHQDPPVTTDVHGDEPPGPLAVPGPPAAETPAEKAEVKYKFGVTGFLRGEGAGNFRLSDFSYDANHTHGRVVYRIKPYAFWHPTDYLDIHIEGQGDGFVGGGRDDWQLALYQGHIEARLPDSKLLSLKAGRQEFSYGSNFMLGPDSFYNGLTFDAGRLRIQPSETLTVDLLGGYYAKPMADGVKGNIAGAYGTWSISDGNALEAYYLRDTGSTDRHSGEELDSVGLRGTAKVGVVLLELEPVYQFGEAFNGGKGDNDNISAFGGHADATAEGDLAGLHHKVWLGYATGSGSRAAATGGSTRYEFRNPNNDTAIVGDMNAIGDLSGANVGDHHASGLHVYTLGYGVDLTKQLNLSATGHYFRAVAVEDGFSKNLGLETDLTLTYNFSENYSLLLGYDHFFTGSFFKDASGSGKDIHYGYAMLQFNLEKAKLKAKKGA